MEIPTLRETPPLGMSCWFGPELVANDLTLGEDRWVVSNR